MNGADYWSKQLGGSRIIHRGFLGFKEGEAAAELTARNIWAASSKLIERPSRAGLQLPRLRGSRVVEQGRVAERHGRFASSPQWRVKS
ncbi:MAG: hypothetical protein QW057_10120 [Candidatus Bathyarchaeia archaeon]